MAGYWSDTPKYIALALVILGVIAAASRHGRKKESPRLSKLAALSFALIIAGITSGERQKLGYSLLGAGVLLALVDMTRKRPKPKE